MKEAKGGQIRFANNPHSRKVKGGQPFHFLGGLTKHGLTSFLIKLNRISKEKALDSLYGFKINGI